MTSIMPPPLSPREPRRSGRRSVPASSSASKSTSPGPEPASAVSTSSASSHTNGAKRKRVKEEEHDVAGGAIGEPTVQPVPKGKKGKRKSKKEVSVPVVEVVDVLIDGTGSIIDGEDDDGGVTRCVCGYDTVPGAEEDDDGFGLWIQCEECKCWQHGLCVGYSDNSQVPDQYFCERCRPDKHEELLSKKKKKQPSVARSLSPTHAHSTVILDKAPKRRNTMNSRETAYADDLIKKMSVDRQMEDASTVGDPEEEEDKDKEKKRKTRSESSTSDRPIASTLHNSAALGQTTLRIDEKEELNPAPMEEDEDEPPQPTVTPARGGRGGKRRRGAAAAGDHESKRQPKAYASRRPRTTAQNANSTNGVSTNSTNGASSTNGGNNYDMRPPTDTATPRMPNAPPPQPLLTSWNLPDYLSHLSCHLPFPVPANMKIPISTVTATTSITASSSSTSTSTSTSGNLTAAATATSSTTMSPSVAYVEERGVRVRWPLKRMSVVDMSKRVRGLMEWVGREQGGENDRNARRLAIAFGHPHQMDVDNPKVEGVKIGGGGGSDDAKEMMEKMMEDLIGFQERFGGRMGS